MLMKLDIQLLLSGIVTFWARDMLMKLDIKLLLSGTVMFWAVYRCWLTSIYSNCYLICLSF